MKHSVSSVMGTFWSNLRVARGVTIPQLSKDTGIPVGALHTYFSGAHIPRETALLQICYYFGVDPELGRAKFVEGNKQWISRHNADWHTHDKQRESLYHKYYNSHYAIPICVSFSRKADKDLLDKLDTIEAGKRTRYIKGILRKHLGNDDFSTERLTAEVRDLLEMIYSEVPFDIFMQTLTTLLNTKTFDERLLYGYVSFPTFIKIRKLQNQI